VTVTGRVIGKAWVDHYTQTLQSIRDTGYATYATQHLAPYANAAAGQFSPQRRTWTERLIERFARSRG
jgi:hypothetical protein